MNERKGRGGDMNERNGSGRRNFSSPFTVLTEGDNRKSGRVSRIDPR